MRLNLDTYMIEAPGRLGRVALLMGVVGLLLTFAGLFVNANRFYSSWLVALTFWTTIGFGGLFFVMVHHLTGAKWSVVIRRIAEAVMVGLAPMALLAIPLLFGLDWVYVWTDASFIVEHEAVQAKLLYLNKPFFIIRTVIYFAAWLVIVWRLWRVSGVLDKGWQGDAQSRFVRISAPGVIVFALVTTFSGFDWVMSLMPLWYSTIYGLWFFSGGIVSVMAVIALVVVFLQRQNILVNEITAEHRHDIGKLMFAFLIFWGYMHLSQYLLIWYANLPEETAFYKDRWVGAWKALSVFLAVGGFAIPFVLMMGRSMKRSLTSLAVFAIWMLIVHWVDLFWNIMPPLLHENVSFSWMDVTAFIGMGGLFIHVAWRAFVSRPILPLTDPKLETSLHHINP